MTRGLHLDDHKYCRAAACCLTPFMIEIQVIEIARQQSMPRTFVDCSKEEILMTNRCPPERRA